MNDTRAPPPSRGAARKLPLPGEPPLAAPPTEYRYTAPGVRLLITARCRYSAKGFAAAGSSHMSRCDMRNE